jgi:DNA-binding NtrC family response regulator
VIGPEELSDPIRAAADAAALPGRTPNGIVVRLTDKLTPAVARVERELIKAALQRTHGRVDAAARALGISRKGLYLKRQRLGI